MIRREVHIGQCRLLLGDAREIVPTLTGFDCVVTDPPYGVNQNTDNRRFSGGSDPARRGGVGGPAQGQRIEGDASPFDPRPYVLGKEQIIWGWHNFPDLLPRGSCLVWIKRNDHALNSFLSDAETAWHSRGHGVYCFRDLSNNAIAKARAHPTQKPLSLMEWCIKRTRGGTVLDPFAGSGTTGVACTRLGRPCILIEIDEGYFDAMCRRVSEAHRQPKQVELL